MLSFIPQEAIASKMVSPQKKEISTHTVKPNEVLSNAFEIKKKVEALDEIKNEEKKETITFNGNWRELVDQLKLGLVKALAQQSELVSFKNNEMILSIADEHKHLLNETYQKN